MDLRSWEREPLPVLGMPTMISAEERRYLRWLTRTQWTGAGCVVEIGPWLGGSTACLAEGMRAAGHEARGRLHVFDNFLWREFMAAKAPLPLAPGESFEPFFRQNLGRDAELVVSHAMSLPDEVIPGDPNAEARRSRAGESPPFVWRVAEPIEILFLDGAKSWRGMRHLLQAVRGALIPGRTLLACQDYKHWGAYWVAMILERLRGHLEPAHLLLEGSTATFRVTSAIPKDAIDAIEDDVATVPTAAGLEALECSIGWLVAAGDLRGGRRLALARVRFLGHQGHVEQALAVYGELARGWPRSDRSQIDGARAYLEKRLGRPLPALDGPGLFSRLARAFARGTRSASNTGP